MKYNKIIAVEPDRTSVNIMKKCFDYLNINSNIEVIQKGVGAKRETLTFHKSADKEYESANFFQNCKKIISVDRLDQNENMLDEAVECDTLDNLLKDENGNLLIKVDVQGMEYDCLCGAKETIAQKHPIILVEVGTYSENMFDVLLMINSLYDRYRIYIRQRNICGNSRTVAFAIPKKEG